MIGISSIKNYL